MMGLEFERECVRILHDAGYWAHRINPNAAGQQPFDIIAIKGSRICIYDAKVVSVGHRFPFSRIEDNQLNSFEAVSQKVHACEIGLLIYAEGKIHYMSWDHIVAGLQAQAKSVDVLSLPEWRPI